MSAPSVGAFLATFHADVCPPPIDPVVVVSSSSIERLCVVFVRNASHAPECCVVLCLVHVYFAT